MSEIFNSPTYRKIILVLIGTLTLVVLIWLIFTVKFVSWDFRNELWAPSYLLWHRQSAYNTTIIFPISLAVWFPQIIGVFFPLGLLSEYQAANVWLALNIGLLVYLVWSISRRAGKDNPQPLLFSILLIAVFLYPPTLRLLILGQMDLLFVVAAIEGVNALEQRHPVQAAFWFALVLTKPQLTLLVLPCMAVYLVWIERDWRNTLGFGLATCLFIPALTTPLWISNPAWFGDFLSNLAKNPRWLQPSIFLQLSSRLGFVGLLIWLLLLVAALVISLRLWKTAGPAYALLWTMALTPLVNPYVWSWDFTLLLPLFIDTATRLTTRTARITLAGFYALALVLSIVALQSGVNVGDDVLWWFPLVILAGIVSALRLSKTGILAG